jgi:hypothetical protein
VSRLYPQRGYAHKVQLMKVLAEFEGAEMQVEDVSSSGERRDSSWQSSEGGPRGFGGFASPAPSFVRPLKSLSGDGEVNSPLPRTRQMQSGRVSRLRRSEIPFCFRTQALPYGLG